MPNPVKIEKVAELKQRFEESKDFILTDYRGLSVEQITDLRGKLRENSTDYKVVKNKLARLALDEVGVAGGEGYLTGPTAIAFSGDETPAAAKVLTEFAARTSLAVKAGYVDGTFFDEQGIEEISRLPGKDAILSMLAGAMQGLLSRFVGDMQSVLSTFALTLKAIEDKKN